MSNLTAVIGADTSRFTQEVESARYMLNKFIKESKNQSNTIKKNTQVTNEQISSYQRVIKSLEKVSSGTMTAKQQQSALTTQIKELKIQWANLSDTAKKGEFGKSLASTLTEAQARLKTLTKQISQTNNEMTKFGGGSKFANLGGVNQLIGNLGKNIGVASGAMSTFGIAGGTALGSISSKSSLIAGLGSTLANPYVLAGAAITGAGVAWFNYNKEFEHTMRLTQEFTGLEGAALENLRNGIKSVADVWNKDYTTVLSGVDNLMVQFHIDGETALDIIKSGFVSGADDAGRMLDLIKQYSGSFNDAGISASELVALIAQTRSGIFSEDGMAVIEMAAKNIRNMKDKTVESLSAIGISADEMKKKLQNGTMSTMDALREISKKLSEFPAQSQEVGVVLQDVFGKKGSAAGYELVTALGSISTNLDEVKKQTGDYGKSLEDLADADKRLEDAMSETFGIADGGFETLSNKAKTLFYEALILLINEVNEFKETIKTWYTYTKASIDQLCYSLNEFAEAWNSLTNLDFDGVKQHLSNAFSLKQYNKDIDEYYRKLVAKDDEYHRSRNNKTNNKSNNKTIPEKSGNDDILKKDNNKSNDKTEEVKGEYNKLKKELDDLKKKLIEESIKPDDIYNPLTNQTVKQRVEELPKLISDKEIALGIKVDPEIKNREAAAKKLSEQIESLSKDFDNIEFTPKQSSFDAAIGTNNINTNTLGGIENQMNFNDSLIEQLNNIKKKYEEIGVTSGSSYDKVISKIKEVEDAQSNLGNKAKEVNDAQIDWENQQKKIQSVSDTVGIAGDSFGNLGQVFQAFGDNSVGAIMQVTQTTLDSVSQMLPAIMSLIGAKQAESIAGATASGAGMPFPLNLAAIASGVAAVVAAFSQIGSYADGGIIEAASSIGDYNIARVNNGEMILNGTQQNHLFNLLDGNGNVGGSTTVVGGEVKIKGSDLYLALKNYGSIKKGIGKDIGIK